MPVLQQVDCSGEIYLTINRGLRMDVHRLEVFCRVVELGSFTRAAESVRLTQPTVSEHIRALEDEIGEKLIDRLGREVRPTPAGKRLHQYARDIIRLRDEALQEIRRFSGRLAGSLIIGASTIPGTYILPQILGSFKTVLPNIHVTLRIAGSGEIVRTVLDGQLEAGIIGAWWDDRRLQLEEIFSDELSLTVNSSHPWASRTSVALDELQGEPFIIRERGSGTRVVTEKALADSGFSPSRLFAVVEMGSTEAVRQGVKAGLGIAILSSRAVAEDVQSGSLATVKLVGVNLSRSFYLVLRKNRRPSPLCSAFIEHLRAQASSGK